MTTQRLFEIQATLCSMYVELVSLEDIPDCEMVLRRLEQDMCSAVVCITELVKKKEEETSNKDKSPET